MFSFSHEPSGSIKGEKCLGHISNYQLLKKESAPPKAVTVAKYHVAYVGLEVKHHCHHSHSLDWYLSCSVTYIFRNKLQFTGLKEEWKGILQVYLLRFLFVFIYYRYKSVVLELITLDIAVQRSRNYFSFIFADC
jgi:hypothetical protein